MDGSQANISYGPLGYGSDALQGTDSAGRWAGLAALRGWPRGRLGSCLGRREVNAGGERSSSAVCCGGKERSDRLALYYQHHSRARAPAGITHAGTTTDGMPRQASGWW